MHMSYIERTSYDPPPSSDTSEESGTATAPPKPRALTPHQNQLVGERIEEVLVSLRRVIHATDMHSRHLNKTTGLTAPQVLLLQAIQHKGNVTIGELAKEISLSQATVTTILDRLEQKALVVRKRSTSDRRKVHAELTEKALYAIKNSPKPLQEKFKREFSQLDDWEQTMIIASLQRVAHMMDAQDLDAAPLLDVGEFGHSN